MEQNEYHIVGVYFKKNGSGKLGSSEPDGFQRWHNRWLTSLETIGKRSGIQTTLGTTPILWGYRDDLKDTDHTLIQGSFRVNTQNHQK